MINYLHGDILESSAQTLVNPVNTVGVMGKGLALAFKHRYPEMFRQYHAICRQNGLTIGQLWLYKTPDKWVLNFPTKKHWREKSRQEYIEAGLKRFVDTYAESAITSIAFPMLGCGLGGLDWETQVRPLMERYLQGLSIDVLIYR